MSSRRGAAHSLPWAMLALGGLLLSMLALPVIVLLLSASLAAMGETLIEGETLRSLQVTLLAAGISTAFGLAMGVPLAYVLARYRFRGQRLVEGVLGLPVIIPHTSAGVALLLTYGARGPVGALFKQVGVFFTDHLLGVAVAMCFVSVSYLVNSAREAIAAIHPELEQAALVDGASPWGVFWKVTLPLAQRGITNGALLMWARGISEFGAVVLLAYHPRTLSVLVYERFQGFGLARATPLAALLVIVALIVFAILSARYTE